MIALLLGFLTIFVGVSVGVCSCPLACRSSERFLPILFGFGLECLGKYISHLDLDVFSSLSFSCDLFSVHGDYGSDAIFQRNGNTNSGHKFVPSSPVALTASLLRVDFLVALNRARGWATI